jgi:hypothetical protein
MAATAAGVFRRTAIEPADQRVSWQRSDQAFFAAGACHILAWACRECWRDRPIEIAAVRGVGERPLLHVFALWSGWALDHSGWNPEPQLLEVNAHFEGRQLECVKIRGGLATFCQRHDHRMPHQYCRDPRQRARDYVSRRSPPWA